jgi:hypothetical protein
MFLAQLASVLDDLDSRRRLLISFHGRVGRSRQSLISPVPCLAYVTCISATLYDHLTNSPIGVLNQSLP